MRGSAAVLGSIPVVAMPSPAPCSCTPAPLALPKLSASPSSLDAEAGEQLMVRESGIVAAGPSATLWILTGADTSPWPRASGDHN